MKTRFIGIAVLVLAMSLMLTSCDSMTSGGLLQELITGFWEDPEDIPEDVSEWIETIPEDWTWPETTELETTGPTPPDPEPTPSEGLEFQSNGDGTCALVGSGTCTDVDVIIPEISPDGEVVTRINVASFDTYLNMRSITIPACVTFFEIDAIMYCRNLESITVSEDNLVYHSENNCIIETETNTLVFGCKGSKIPDGVVNIGDNAFFYCEDLTEITIPESVTHIGWNAFSDCVSLTSITIPDSVTSIETRAFAGCFGLTSITIPASVTYISNDAFSGCLNMKNIYVAEGNANYMSIGNCLLPKEGNMLLAGCKNSTIPDNVTDIGERAFMGQYFMASIVIPKSVTNIEYQAFAGCESLTDVFYTGTEEEWNAIVIGKSNDDLLSATIHFNYVPES